jgi:hypothetical protein
MSRRRGLMENNNNNASIMPNNGRNQMILRISQGQGRMRMKTEDTSSKQRRGR